jgi:hypothetical protein
MARTYTYRDALRLLGGQESGFVQVIDRISSVVMLTLGVSGVKEILSWFDPRGEFIKSSHQLVSDLQKRIGPARGRSRTEVLAAAHSIIVVTAYFEAFKAVRLPFNPKKLKLEKTDQLALLGGEPLETHTAQGLLGGLLDLDLPIPTPYEPFEDTSRRLFVLYQELSASLVRFLRGLALWDEKDDTTRRRIDRIIGDIPELAVERYAELFRSTAAQCPEFFVWASLQDHAATRKAVSRSAESVRGPLLSLYEQVGELTVGLSRLEALLSEHTERFDLTGAISALATGHRAALTRPIVEMTSLDAHLGLTIPALGQAYVDPGYRTRVCDADARPAEESWWSGQPRRADLPAFLAGFFTSPYAGDRPLVILGQPGSGKSVLTRVLAARLPQDDFVVIRVELRTAPANAPLQDQIEAAVHRLTGEQVAYPALTRAAGDAIPVVLLDGFDELLQSTGLSRSNYLEQVREFQQREADLGRPVAVVVTTRTVVAERARFPRGSVVVRLEPFDDTQVTRWLDVWNTGNADYYRRTGVQPLDRSSTLRHRPLAAQPLLLLMLALYEADGNALSAAGESLGEADLYEGLLRRFALREIAKLHPALTGERLDEEVETELERLGVVAFAMFNRGRQSVRDAEVNRDVQDLLGGIRARPAEGTFDEPLTPADVIVGRFFFIHESQASFKESRTRTYEFLHATFGEYLVARMVGRELDRLARLYEVDSLATARRNAGRLRALLSFAPLITRLPVVDFLRGIFQESPHLDRMRRIVGDLIERALLPIPAEETVTYAPMPLTAPARHANFSVNAVLLGLICAGGRAMASDLFGGGIETWRSHTSLWKSQLTPEAWNSLVYGVTVDRLTRDDRRDIELALGAAVSRGVDLEWSTRHSISTLDLTIEADFLCEPSNDWLIVAVSSLPNRVDALRTLVIRSGEFATEAQLLVRLSVPQTEYVDAESDVADCEAILRLAEQRPDVAATYLDVVLNCYLRRLSIGSPLYAPQLLGQVLKIHSAEAGHVLRSVRCGLEEWAITGLKDDEVKTLVRHAAEWLDERDHSVHLTELWVLAVEAGLAASEISPRMEGIERFVRDSGEDILVTGVSRTRLRRALRLSAGR